MNTWILIITIIGQTKTMIPVEFKTQENCVKFAETIKLARKTECDAKLLCTNESFTYKCYDKGE